MKRLLLLLVSLILALSCRQAPVPVIFDTDMGNDIDDALALAMLYRYVDEGKIDLLGIASSKTDTFSVKYIDILNNYYGHPDIPIGKLTGAEQYQRLDTYAEQMVSSGKWQGSVQDYDALPESADLLKDLLSKQKDHSVVIVAVGFFTNLSRLLSSDPELVKAKVKSLVLMAGDFEGPERSAEHNVRYDIPATQHICREWPSEVVLSPFKVGLDLLYPVGPILENLKYESPNPVAEAYKVYKKMPYDRPSWDLSAVLYAVDGKDLFEETEAGVIRVDDEGKTWFEADKNGKHSYISVPESSRQTIIDRYLNLTYEK